MKKILLSFTAILLLPVFNLAWAGLYMVGDAVSGDWGTRLAMTETQDGIYTRIVSLQNGELKFVESAVGNVWFPQYVAQDGNVNMGKNDYVSVDFLIAEEGLYTVEVDMSSSAASPKMKVTKEESNPHIIGDVVAGFDLDNATPMTRLSDEVYVWNGQLEAGLEYFGYFS